MAITLRLTKGSELTFQELDDNFTDLDTRVQSLETSNSNDISLTSLSVVSNPAGTAGLSYDNTSGVFTYTPPDLSSYALTANVPTAYTDSDVDAHLNQSNPTDGYVLSWTSGDYAWVAQSSGGSGIALSDLSVGAPAAASGSGSITYDPLTGVFTYTPPDTLNSFSVVTNPASGGGSLVYNNSIGQFAYTPPDLSSYLTSYTETNDLTVNVTWANVPPANITEFSVTQHQAALLISESQIIDLGNYATLSDISLTINPATIGGAGSLSYNQSTGEFTFEPADINGSVDIHLNTSTATAGQVLSWTGTDYDWVAQSGGGANAITQGDSAVTVTDTGSDGNIEFKTENTARWDITSAGHLIPATNSTYDIGSAESKVRHFYLSSNSLKFVDDSDPLNPVEYPVGISGDNRLTFNSNSVKTTSYADAPVGGPIDITLTNHFIVPGQNYSLADGTYIGQELKLWRNPGSGFNDITVANAIWTNGSLVTATATNFTWRLEELSTGMYSCIWNGTGWILANGSTGA